MHGLLILIALFAVVDCHDEHIVSIAGVRYADVLPGRFRESVLVARFELSAQRPAEKRCFIDRLEDDVSEDCLFLSVFRHINSSVDTPALVYITNEAVSPTKIKSIVSKELTVVVARARQGVFGTYGSHDYTLSDISNIFAFLANERSTLRIGEISVLAEEHLAEAVSLVIDRIGISRAILFGGNALTRSDGKFKFPEKITRRLLKTTQCNLPSEEQAVDCLRAIPLKKFVNAADVVKRAFYPFGDPFRVQVHRKVSNKQVPTLYGIWKSEAPERYGYPVTANFTAEYTYKSFKQFLAGILPDAVHKNAPLLRRLALHHYVHTKGDKTNTFFLFEKMKQMMFERDFALPTQKLAMHLAKSKKNLVWLLQYGIDNPPRNCLQDGGWDDIQPFCDRLLGYFKRFAAKGAPTDAGCSAENPTFPALRTTKRDYFIKLHADGKPEWDFDFYKEAAAFWHDLVPSIDSIELAGRRDAIFPEEQEVDPLEEEDDQQAWHKAQAAEARASKKKDEL